MVKTQHISGGGTKFPSENMYMEIGIAWEGLWDVILGQPPRRKFSLYTPRIIFSIKPSSFQFSIFFLVSPTDFHIQSVGLVGNGYLWGGGQVFRWCVQFLQIYSPSPPLFLSFQSILSFPYFSKFSFFLNSSFSFVHLYLVN